VSHYATGDMARLCNVSVRTVQFYDEKGLLNPTGLTEGGRRLYSEEDLGRLRLICLLKTLGLSLNSIKGILGSSNSSKVLLLLLEEQSKHLTAEIEEKREAKETLDAIMERIRSTETILIYSIDDIGHIMEGRKELGRTHATMLVLGIIMDIIEIATVVLWIMTGIWIPFAIGMAAVIIMGCLMTRIYLPRMSCAIPRHAESLVLLETYHENEKVDLPDMRCRVILH